MIYVVTHKIPSTIPQLSDCYRWLIVGGNHDISIKLNGIMDTSGNSISNLNSSFCELTALYWIWRNCSDDYKGLVHYRRFFTSSSLSKNAKYILNNINISTVLKQYDCIVPDKKYLPTTVQSDYAYKHSRDDLILLSKVLKDLYPDYFPYFVEALNYKYIIPYNMFVASKNIFNSYCSWLFPILFKLYDMIDLSTKDPYQKRVFGFLSERLLNVYILRNSLKCFYSPVLHIESSNFNQFKLLVEKKLHHCLFNPFKTHSVSGDVFDDIK